MYAAVKRRHRPHSTSARHFSQVEQDPLASLQHIQPPHVWSWHSVDDVAAAERSIAPGRYTTRAHNQHRAGWCGACYMMSVIHMITDRLNVELGSHSSIQEMHPFVDLDAQRMLNEYDAFRSESMPQWNACRGGDPMRVLACLEEGKCQIHTSPSAGYAWRGFPSKEKQSSTDAAHRRVAQLYRIPNQSIDVKRCIYRDGPVGVSIDAECLIDCDEEGVADTSSQQPRNHAATIIGWTERRGEEMWILRNSWGEDWVPENLPDDISCVRRGSNKCTPHRQSWTGMPDLPGHVLVPIRYLETDASYAASDLSPFYACTLE